MIKTNTNKIYFSNFTIDTKSFAIKLIKIDAAINFTNKGYK